MQAAPLKLKKDQERRLLAGHCWVYSNEIDTRVTPLKGLEPGQPVEIYSQRERWIGHGYVNPHSLIAARLVSRRRDRPLSASLLVERVSEALALRERLYRHPYYRLIHGEGDDLPGLVVDRYGDLLVVQINTAGMEFAKESVLTALEQVVRPKRILVRNDSAVRELEGLGGGNQWVLGDDPGTVEVHEDELRFTVSPSEGQKTGWFFDQAENRRRLTRYGNPERALDVCCYLGGWGLRAAANDADEVVCVDTSRPALKGLCENAERNGLRERIRAQQGDAFDVLRAQRDAEERFDLVMLDPPAFIKRRRDEKEGLPAYQRLNQLGIELATPGGILVSSSCSFHLSREAFLHTIQRAASKAQRRLQLLEVGQQGPDHPVHPAIPETAYLKTFFFRVLDGR